MGLMVAVSLPVQMREAQSMGKEALADSVRSCESPHLFICELCACRAHPQPGDRPLCPSLPPPSSSLHLAVTPNGMLPAPRCCRWPRRRLG